MGGGNEAFTKPFLTVKQQIRQLRGRGMVVEDEAEAEHWLRTVTYYRLSPYWKPFEKMTGEDGDPFFVEGAVGFRDVATLYQFDRGLRQLVWDAMERIEVAFRGSWAYHLAMKQEPKGYRDPRHYRDRARFEDSMATLLDNYHRSRSEFVTQFKLRYRDPSELPVWMAAELVTFGELAHWILNLKSRKSIRSIVKPLGLGPESTKGVMARLQEVRNVCAHHDRLWDRSFRSSLTWPSMPEDHEQAVRGSDLRQLYDTLVLVDFLLSHVDPGSAWRRSVLQLIDGCPAVDEGKMGFPDGWRTRPFWNPVEDAVQGAGGVHGQG